MNRSLAIFILIAILTATLGACGKETTNGAAPTDAGAAKGVANKSVELQTEQKKFLTIETIGTADGADVIALPGRISFRPQAQSAVGAPVTGRVAAQLVRAGETVKAGTPLLVIESAEAAAIRATLDQAQTRLTAAEQAYRRHVEMVDKGVGLEMERQEAEARLKDAKAEQERARQSVLLIGAGSGSRVTLHAPASGVIIAIRAAAGASVAPGGEALVEIGNPQLLQLVADVTESDLRRIAVGQDAEFEIPALNARGRAKISGINPQVDVESRRVQIYLTPEKSVAGMQAGMLAQLALRVSKESLMTVPVTAVLIRNGTLRVVYVEKQDGGYEAREVQIGSNRDGQVVILKGINPGDRVVTKGALLLDTQAELLL